MRTLTRSGERDEIGEAQHMRPTSLFYSLLVSVAAAFAADVPRPEFPQPQFVRAQWQTLNGPWQFDFDDRNTGLDNGWSSATHALSKQITVPYCFESKLERHRRYIVSSGSLVSRKFSLPAPWKGKNVLLKFGAVDYRAWVWLNGRSLGFHEGGNVPFTFDITPFLIAVRTRSPCGWKILRRTVPSLVENSTGRQNPKGIFYTRTSGIWQPVWLEGVGSSYMNTVQMTPAVDGTLRIEAEIANPEPGSTLNVKVLDRGQVVATAGVHLQRSSDSADRSCQSAPLVGDGSGFSMTSYSI